MRKRTYEIWKRHTDGPDECWDDSATLAAAQRRLATVYGEGFYLVEVVRTRLPVKSKKEDGK